MQVFSSLKEWQFAKKNIPTNKSIGFVPTMGNLHKGHVSLLENSQKENDITIASIFINRMQFNKQDDFNNYPRTIDADLEILEKNKIDYCLLPNEQEIYIDDYRYQINEISNSLYLEGKYRPGHFTGVLTIVMKLLNLVKPNRCYFGEKDYQQYQLINDMTKAFFIDTEIKVCPTIREDSGLAFSSRNNLLSIDERKLANQFANILHNSSSSTDAIEKLNEAKIEVIYVEDYGLRRFAAVQIGKVRLIDNIAI